jgi:hypothetical protein
MTSGVGASGWTRPDGRRTLQLVLATIWLIDGVLQLQSYFFTKDFGLRMISGMSSGNASFIAHPINWSGATIGRHSMLVNTLFALIQITIGLAIAFRPTVRIGLGVSIVWSAGVWWVGEGLGGVLNGQANPVNGGPGAVLLYALLALLLWPSDRADRPAPFIAARAVGAPTAKALWLVLWGSLSYFALVGAHRSPRGLHDLVLREADGEPGWMAWIDRHAARLVDHRGLAMMVVVAVLLALVAVGVYCPSRLGNAALVVAVVVAVVVWVVGEDFGTLFTNGATDLNSGPLFILLAAAYWRPSTGVEPAPAIEAAVNLGGT